MTYYLIYGCVNILYKLLIVDDNNKDRRIVREMVDWSALDIEVAGEAYDGKSALMLIEKMNIDIMITDISMPAMNGIKLAQKVKALCPKIKVIFMSYYKEFEYAKSAIMMNIYSYILKPIRLHELKDAVQKVVDIRRLEDKNAKDKEALNKKVEETLPILKKEFYRNMVFGALDDPIRIYENMGFFGINESDFLYVQILCIRFVYTKKALLTFNDHYIQVCASMDILMQDEFPNHNILCALQTDASEYTIIKKTCNEEHTMQYALSLYNLLREKINIDVIIGVSKIASFITYAFDLYKQAHEAAASDLSGSGPVVLFHDNRGVYLESRNKVIVDKIKNIVHEHYNKPITVDDISKNLFMSSRQLNNIFKKETNQTIFNYLIEYRMNVAKKLLASPDAKIYEVCEQLGYSNKSFFTLLFKSVVGQTPKEFRNSCGF